MVWRYGGHANDSTIKPLKIAQNKLLRTISFSNARTSSSVLATKLNILPLQNEITLRTTLAACRIISSDNPSLKIQTDHAHKHHTRFARNKIPIPVTRSVKYGTNSLRYKFIKTYNSLPENIKHLSKTSKSNIFLKNRVKELIWLGLKEESDQ